MRNMHISIEGKEGMFSVEKKVSFFYEHTTKEGLEADLKEITKELKKMVKKGRIMITLVDSDQNYNRQDIARLIFNDSQWDSLYELDQRKFDTINHDYGNSHLIHFSTMNELHKHVSNYVYLCTRNTLGDIPENKTLYAQSLNTDNVR